MNGSMQSPIEMEVDRGDINFVPCLPEIEFGPNFNTVYNGNYRIIKHTCMHTLQTPKTP